jgi:hypothetical protein
VRATHYPMFRYKLRTLLIVTTFAPALLAIIVLGFGRSDPEMWAGYIIGLIAASWTLFAWWAHFLRSTQTRP